jgi:hypothetical protein
MAVTKNGPSLNPVIELASAAFALACKDPEAFATNQASHHVTVVTRSDNKQSIAAHRQEQRIEHTCAPKADEYDRSAHASIEQ